MVDSEKNSKTLTIILNCITYSIKAVKYGNNNKNKKIKKDKENNSLQTNIYIYF